MAEAETALEKSIEDNPEYDIELLKLLIGNMESFIHDIRRSITCIPEDSESNDVPYRTRKHINMALREIHDLGTQIPIWTKGIPFPGVCDQYPEYPYLYID